MKPVFSCLIWMITFLITAPYGLGQNQSLSAEIKKQTIDDLSTLLIERYAYKEVGPKLQQLLQQNLKAGRYEAYHSPLEFSLAVTRDLRSLQPDRHLALNFNPQIQATKPTTPPQPLTPEERAKQASAFNRQMNYGFKSVQFLNGNIGYLKLDYFDSYLEYSRPVADAAMAFFKNSDALIIDLRENGGGSGEMVGYIAGFFFKDRTLTGTSYNRLTDSTEESFVTPQPADKQLTNIDLYILTSKVTVSAAEALAYNLKYLKQAEVIGETSAGAANPGRVTRLNHLFTAFIPNRHGMHIVTGKNWEGTGVPVDIACPAEDALRIARLEALKKLRQKATDPLQQKKISHYITYLEKIKPETELPAKALRQYVGEYQGGRTITLKDGKLYYAGSAEAGGQLYFISTDVFMLSEGDVTITFKRDTQNRVIELSSRWSLTGAAAVAGKAK
jgi:retinol-binding protein 3